MADDAPAPAPALLAAFEGARPPAPAWFDHALAQAPERARVEVEGAEVEVLTWGPPEGQGLLFLHGAGAHAGWWSFIAPFFAAQGRRVAALTWSGMGGSAWRERYGFDTYAAEAVAAARHAGLFAHAARPDLVAHSFGGAIACHLAASADGARFGRIVVADAAVRPPGRRWSGPPWRTNPNRLYPTEAAALARFRLAPPQDCAKPLRRRPYRPRRPAPHRGGLVLELRPLRLGQPRPRQPAAVAGGGAGAGPRAAGLPLRRPLADVRRRGPGLHPRPRRARHAVRGHYPTPPTM